MQAKYFQKELYKVILYYYNIFTLLLTPPHPPRPHPACRAFDEKILLTWLPISYTYEDTYNYYIFLSGANMTCIN